MIKMALLTFPGRVREHGNIKFDNELSIVLL